jgi:diaminopropionate ammonia-lyase
MAAQRRSTLEGMNRPMRTHDSFDITNLWPDYRPSRLVELPDIALLVGVDRVFVKDESERPLGNFKVLGGMVAGLQALARAAGIAMGELERLRDVALPRLICASDGNHGLAVTAAAQRAGSGATIYLANGVNPVRAAKIEALGGQIVWIDGTYDAAVDAAAAAAARGDGLLISDTVPDPNDRVVRDVMAGYALITRELVDQFRNEAKTRPSHMFIQAGVGGLAAAMADGLHEHMSPPGKLLVVEPESAGCVGRGLAEGQPTLVVGDLHTSAEMLACGLASAPALEILLRHEAQSVLVGEEHLAMAVRILRDAGGPATTPSGACGLAGLLHVAVQPELRAAYGLNLDSKVLLVATEGPVAG